MTTQQQQTSEQTARLVQTRAVINDLMGTDDELAGVGRSTSSLGGRPVLDVMIDGIEPRGTTLWFHGGAFIAGSPEITIGVAALTARATETRLRSVDYRLAPEHPFPAALDDALSAYRAVLEEVPVDELIVGGESAGAALAVLVVLAARDAGLPLPRGIVMYSPTTDLALTGASHRTKAAVDESLTTDLLTQTFSGYADGASLDDPRLSAVHADLRGLPPMLVVVGSHEILLDDSLELVARAAAADVDVDLVVGAGMPHVFPGRDGLQRADEALETVGEFVRRRLS